MTGYTAEREELKNRGGKQVRMRWRKGWGLRAGKGETKKETELQCATGLRMNKLDNREREPDKKRQRKKK